MDHSINSILPIVLCGGTGTRLWPLSRESYPKQYLKISDDEPFSFLQKTVKRIEGIKNIESPIFVCNEEHRFLVAQQINDIGIKPNSILLEPEGRNTAPAITIAAIKASQESEDKVILILPSDHIINNVYNFEKVINKGLDYAKEGKIVTFGIKPYKSEVGYGYIESKRKFNEEKLIGDDVIRFIEKPQSKVAEKLILKNNLSWNSGILMLKISTLINEIKKYEPELFDFCNKSLIKSFKDLDFHRLEKESFANCKNISIDNALMEKTNLAVVLPLNVGWSDVGSWESMWSISKKDKDMNSKFGKVLIEDVKNSYIRSEDRLVVGIGLEDLVVVETLDAILVADKKKSQNIKEIVGQLEKNGEASAKEHKKVFRPWGNYLTISVGENWQVKELRLNPGQSVSLQMHNYRAEHWIVVSGVALVERDGEKIELNKNESIYIPLGVKHRLSNISENPLILIEVQSGSYLGEDDIIRFDDKYGRN